MNGKIVLAAELLILRAATGRDVNQSRALGLAYFVPGDDAMRFSRSAPASGFAIREDAAGGVLRGQFVERPGVGEADQVAPGDFFQYLDTAAAFQDGADGRKLVGLVLAFHLQILDTFMLEVALRDVVNPIAVANLEVSHLRIHGDRDVGGQRPGSGGPDQQRRVFLALHGESDKDGCVGGDAAALRDFHLRKSGAAAAAPRHHVVPAIDESLDVALLQESPDGVIIFVGEGEVAAAVFSRAEFADDFAGSRSFRETAGQLDGNYAGRHRPARRAA